MNHEDSPGAFVEIASIAVLFLFHVHDATRRLVPRLDSAGRLSRVLYE